MLKSYLQLDLSFSFKMFRCRVACNSVLKSSFYYKMLRCHVACKSARRHFIYKMLKCWVDCNAASSNFNTKFLDVELTVIQQVTFLNTTFRYKISRNWVARTHIKSDNFLILMTLTLWSVFTNNQQSHLDDISHCIFPKHKQKNVVIISM